MDKIKLLIADDHKIVLEGIVSLLQPEESVQIVGTAANGFEVLEVIKKSNVDVCLLDINMPGMDGLEAARKIKAEHPGVKIIILTTYDDKQIVSELIKIGVSGYLLKNTGRIELMEGILKVMSGRYCFSAEIEEIIIDGITENKNIETITFTEREVVILRLLAREFTNEMIANELHISYRTVETHRKNMMLKTKSHNLAGLLRHAYSKGFITH